MKLIRCNNGHVFNAQAHQSCPYCSISNVDVGVLSKVDDAIVLENSNKTLAYWIKETSVAPVVGWLVCIAGGEKGRDFRIISERNFIGRSEEMHICIKSDMNISRKNHCSILYSPKQRIFMLSPGEGSGIVYLQGIALYESKQIFNNDLIEIGDNKFIFIALCGDKFDWNI